MEKSLIKILLVDDEPDILEFLSYNLRKEGFEVRTSGNGLDAMSEAVRFQPDLIVLDMMMPGPDGISVCKTLRADSRFASTIIVFLTALDSDVTQMDALDAGGDDFVAKPLKPKVFISRINALLRRSLGKKMSENTNLDLITLHDLVIDKQKVSVTVAGVALDLTKKEFEIISLLASKPSKVFSREEILRLLWGTDVIVGERTIDAHIKTLRQAMGNDYIKTLKGFGYKLEI